MKTGKNRGEYAQKLINRVDNGLIRWQRECGMGKEDCLVNIHIVEEYTVYSVFLIFPSMMWYLVDQVEGMASYNFPPLKHGKLIEKQFYFS